MKSARGEADFCFIFKISGFLFFLIPVPLSISVNMWIRSTLYGALIKMHLGLGRFLFVCVK